MQIDPYVQWDPVRSVPAIANFCMPEKSNIYDSSVVVSFCRHITSPGKWTHRHSILTYSRWSRSTSGHQRKRNENEFAHHNWSPIYSAILLCRRFHAWLTTFQLTATMSLAIGQYQHRTVLENDAFESLLPLHYRNPFFRTPKFRKVLAKSSWLAAGEQLVIYGHRIGTLLFNQFTSKIFFRCLNEKLRKSIVAAYTLCSHMLDSFQGSSTHGSHRIVRLNKCFLKKETFRFFFGQFAFDRRVHPPHRKHISP